MAKITVSGQKWPYFDHFCVIIPHHVHFWGVQTLRSGFLGRMVSPPSLSTSFKSPVLLGLKHLKCAGWLAIFDLIDHESQPKSINYHYFQK